MDYLLNNRTHPTADQIYGALSPTMPSLSKTTVYNTLKILENRGAVVCIDIDPTCDRYDADTSVHAHSFCRACGAVADVWVKDAKFAKRNAPEGMQVDSVQLLYKGVCAECASKSQKAD